MDEEAFKQKFGSRPRKVFRFEEDSPFDDSKPKPAPAAAPPLTRERILQIFPGASADFLARNTGPAPVMERDSGHGALGKRQVQKPDSRRFLVRITSIRTRLLDYDNLCEKYHVDLCRYAGIISGDEAGTTKIETTQRKAKKGEEERTLIEVFTIESPVPEQPTLL